MSAAKIEIDMKLARAIAMDAAEKGMRAVVEEGRNVLVTDILSRPGTGRLYRKGKTVVHRASSPGEPPAPDTGELRRRIFTEVTRGDREVRGLITANTEYAAALELGTERMAARPYLSRLLRDHADRLRSVLARFAR